MNAKSILKSSIFLIYISLVGCAETGVMTAEKQANAANLSNPITVPITTPFDAEKAKAALAKGDFNVSGVLYSRVNRFGREDNSWPKDRSVNNTPMRNVPVFLYPESAHLAELDKQVRQHGKILERWYTRQPSVFNKQPQTKLFKISPDASKVLLTTTTDEFGRFSFENLKPGRYYLDSVGWVTGTFNKSVGAGSSEVTDGTGIYGNRAVVHHTKLVPVNFKTYIHCLEPVSASKNKTMIDLRMRVDYNKMSIEYD